MFPPSAGLKTLILAFQSEVEEGPSQHLPTLLPPLLPLGPFLENLVLKTLDELEQGAAHPDNGW